MKVWITKYALTDQGIIEREVEERPNYPMQWQWYEPKKFMRTNECLKTEAFEKREDAVAHAKKMRAKEIRALKAQLAKLEALRFEE